MKIYPTQQHKPKGADKSSHAKDESKTHQWHDVGFFEEKSIK